MQWQKADEWLAGAGCGQEEGHRQSPWQLARLCHDWRWFLRCLPSKSNWKNQWVSSRMIWILLQAKENKAYRESKDIPNVMFTVHQWCLISALHPEVWQVWNGHPGARLQHCGASLKPWMENETTLHCNTCLLQPHPSICSEQTE